MIHHSTDVVQSRHLKDDAESVKELKLASTCGCGCSVYSTAMSILCYIINISICSFDLNVAVAKCDISKDTFTFLVYDLK